MVVDICSIDARASTFDAGKWWRIKCMVKSMEWTPGGTSEEIEDRRSEGGLGGGGFGGYGPHLGIGGTLVLLVLSFVFKQNLFSVFSTSPSSGQQVSDPAQTRREEPEVKFISFVLDDVQHTWEKLLPTVGASYRHAKLDLFRD